MCMVSIIGEDKINSDGLVDVKQHTVIPVKHLQRHNAVKLTEIVTANFFQNSNINTCRFDLHTYGSYTRSNITEHSRWKVFQSVAILNKFVCTEYTACMYMYQCKIEICLFIK